jgi:putative ABC transport system permease protein
MKIDIIYLALQNIKKRKFRTIGVVIAIAIASATLFSSIILMKSMSSSLELGIAQLGADIMVVPREAEEPLSAILLGSAPSKHYLSRKYEERIAGIEGVEKVAPLVFLETSEQGCCFKPGIFIIGFDPEKDFIVKPWVEKQLGSLAAFETIAGSGYDWMPGFKVYLYGFPFTIAAKMPSTGVAYFDKGIFMPLDRLYWLAKRSREYEDIADLTLRSGQVSAIMIQVAPGEEAERIAKAIEFYFPELKAVVAQKALGNVKKQMLMLLRSLFALSAFTWLTAVILVSVILSMSVNERRREFGILRALGATKRFIFGEVIAEAYILATLGSVLGMLAGYAFLTGFQDFVINYLNMPYLIPNKFYVALISLVIIDVSLLLSTVASFYPAYRSAELEPYEAIRSGE